MDDEPEVRVETGAEELNEQAQAEVQELMKLVRAVDGQLNQLPGDMAARLLASVVAHQIYIRTGQDGRNTLAAYAEFNHMVAQNLMMSFHANLPVGEMVPMHPGAPEGAKVN